MNVLRLKQTFYCQNQITYCIFYSYEVKLRLQFNSESDNFLNKDMILVDKIKQILKFCIYQWLFTNFVKH